jgi:hypothetical protein
MACERFLEALRDRAAGASRPDVDDHVASCAACREELRSLRRALAMADEALGEIGSAEPGPALRARIRSAVAEDAGRDANAKTSLWRWAAALSAAAVLALALAALWRAESTGPTSGAEARLEAQPAPTTSPRTAATPAPPPPGGLASSAAARRDRPAGSAETGLRRPVAPEPVGLPEVLVPPGQDEALLAFTEELRGRVVGADSLLLADLSAPLPEPPPVRIAPIEIGPLDDETPSGL